jgi:hypothetical protein
MRTRDGTCCNQWHQSLLQPLTAPCEVAVA